MQKVAYIFLIMLAGASLCWCIYRDIHIERQYTGDLRNRIAGARLQKDGISPYFYKWKSTDGLRYYDPQNFDTLKVSNITATPFLHQLLYPIADFPQRKISRIWMVIEYILFFLIATISLSFVKKTIQQSAVITTASVFLYTTAWTGHIAAGQIYLLIPFLSLLFYYCICKNEKILFAALAGVSAAMLLLIRPTAVLFLLPFLFFAKKYTSKYLLVLFSSLALIFIFAFGSNQNRLYWKEYSLAMKEQLKSHQSTGASVQQNEHDPGYQNWEGWNMKEVAREYQFFPYEYNKEHGNVFVIVNHSLHTEIPVWLLSGLAGVLLLAIVFLFYKQNGPFTSFTIYPVSILAFSIYMVTDLFSPIHRFLYNGVQWLFPLLLVASQYNRKYGWIYTGIIAGLILNSISLPFMPMENTIGEYLIFLFILIYIINYKPGPTV